MYENLSIQKYLKSDELTTSQKSLLHQLRFKMIKVRANYRNMYEDVQCRWCDEEENQGHILDCAKIMEKCPALFHDNLVKMEDIYSEELVKQIRVTKLCEKVLKVREELLQATEEG